MALLDHGACDPSSLPRAALLACALLAGSIGCDSAPRDRLPDGAIVDRPDATGDFDARTTNDGAPFDASQPDGGSAPDGGSEPSIFASGTRLRWSWLTTDDGYRTPYQLLDAARADEPCTVRADAAGTLRCVPSTYAFVQNDRFTGPDCTQRVAIVSAGTTPTVASDGTRFFVLGPPLAGPTHSGPSCRPDSPNGLNYAAVGAEIPPDTFAAFTRRDLPTVGTLRSGARIVVGLAESADGARTLHYPTLDRDLGAECFFQRAFDGTYRCMPNTLGFAGTQFADAACRTMPLLADVPGRPVPRFAGVYPAAPLCQGRYYEVGERYQGARFTDAARCVPASDERMYYALRPIEATRFIEATIAPVDALGPFRSGARLKVQRLETADGFRAGYGTVDSDLGVPCFATVLDGALVCRPYEHVAQGSSFYADDRCEIPVGIGSACDSARFVQTTDGALYRAGAPHDGPIYARSGARCTATSTTGSVTLLGPRMPASAFVALRIEAP